MQREQPHEIVPETEIPPHKDHEYLRLTQAEEVVLKNKNAEERGAWMRKHMHTTEILARWLETRTGSAALAARARGSEFDLNRSPHGDPKGELARILRDSGLMAESETVAGGAFDTTEYETEQWAAEGLRATPSPFLQEHGQTDEREALAQQAKSDRFREAYGGAPAMGAGAARTSIGATDGEVTKSVPVQGSAEAQAAALDRLENQSPQEREAAGLYWRGSVLVAVLQQPGLTILLVSSVTFIVLARIRDEVWWNLLGVICALATTNK